MTLNFVDELGTPVSYTYDSDGLRGTKIYNGTKSTYHYVSGQLRYETRGSQKFYYFYDASGNLSAIRYYDANGKSYAYFALTNAQGDVVAFYTGAGVCVVTYEYDAWGNIVKQTDTTGINFAELNPIRYRGYYYDTETGLYYLQSRYYNAQVGRFINADGYVSTGQDVLCYNMFAYCENNPVNFSDPTGNARFSLKSLWNSLKEVIIDKVIDKIIGKMKKSPKNAISSTGEALEAGKKIDDTFNPNKDCDLDISKNADNGIAIKNQVVNDIISVGKTGVPVSKTPDDFLFPNIDTYNAYCMEKYNSVYLADEWSLESEETRGSVLADNMILWDPINTYKIGVVEGFRAVETIIEGTGEFFT